jgi:hypothetical protein
LSRDIVEEAAGLVGGSGVSGRHTFYQLKHFVLGKEITTQAKMWKCIRELEARVGAAKSMLNGIEEAEDDLRPVGEALHERVDENKQQRGRAEEDREPIELEENCEADEA